MIEIVAAANIGRHSFTAQFALEQIRGTRIDDYYVERRLRTFQIVERVVPQIQIFE